MLLVCLDRSVFKLIRKKIFIKRITLMSYISKRFTTKKKRISLFLTSFVRMTIIFLLIRTENQINRDSKGTTGNTVLMTCFRLNKLSKICFWFCFEKSVLKSFRNVLYREDHAYVLYLYEVNLRKQNLDDSRYIKTYITRQALTHYSTFNSILRDKK